MWPRLQSHPAARLDTRRGFRHVELIQPGPEWARACSRASFPSGSGQTRRLASPEALTHWRGRTPCRYRPCGCILDLGETATIVPAKILSDVYGQFGVVSCRFRDDECIEERRLGPVPLTEASCTFPPVHLIRRQRPPALDGQPLFAARDDDGRCPIPRSSEGIQGMTEDVFRRMICPTLRKGFGIRTIR